MLKSRMRRLGRKVASLVVLAGALVLLTQTQGARADNYSCWVNYQICLANCPSGNRYQRCSDRCNATFVLCELQGGSGGGQEPPLPIEPGPSPRDTAYNNCMLNMVEPEYQFLYDQCIAGGAPQSGCCFEVASYYSPGIQ